MFPDSPELICSVIFRYRIHLMMQVYRKFPKVQNISTFIYQPSEKFSILNFNHLNINILVCQIRENVFFFVQLG